MKVSVGKSPDTLNSTDIRYFKKPIRYIGTDLVISTIIEISKYRQSSRCCGKQKQKRISRVYFT